MEKHILILATTHDFLWKFEREDVKRLQRMGYIVHYATNTLEPHYVSYQKEIQKMGVFLHHIDIARSPFVWQDNQRALHQLLQLIHRYSIQAIHCHTPVGGLLGRLAGKLCRDRDLIVIYTAHGFHFYKGAPLFNRSVYYQVEKILARYTDILIVINQEDYQAAQTFRLKPNGLLYHIPGIGLDLDTFQPFSEQQRESLREKQGIGKDDFFLVSIGELNENKNQKIVLEALAEMKRRQKHLKHLRHGVCGDGFLRERMAGWIGEMGLTENVALYGYCTDIPKILGCADASILPSKREGLGMAGLESLAMGVPVIAADNRGTREYMKHGQNGFVCRHNTAEEFREGIETIRKLDGPKKENMKALCRESAKPFAKSHTNALMQEIYSEVSKRIERSVYEKQYKNQRHHGGI